MADYTRLNHESCKAEFEKWAETKSAKIFTRLSEVMQDAPFELEKGQYVTVRNGYGHAVGVFEVLGFCEDTTGCGRHIYLDWDCYWYAAKPQNVLTIRADRKDVITKTIQL